MSILKATQGGVQVGLTRSCSTTGGVLHVLGSRCACTNEFSICPCELSGLALCALYAKVRHLRWV
jgi:hypothetical protein